MKRNKNITFAELIFYPLFPPCMTKNKIGYILYLVRSSIMISSVRAVGYNMLANFVCYLQAVIKNCFYNRN